VHLLRDWLWRNWLAAREYALFGTEGDWQRALDAAIESTYGHAMLYSLVALLAGGAGIMIDWTAPPLTQYVPALFINVLAALLGGGAILVPTIGMALFRRQIRRRLRQVLRHSDVPICLECGYDLRGQTARRCPECGAPFGEWLLKRPDGLPKDD
jgi:hypothetical protein